MTIISDRINGVQSSAAIKVPVRVATTENIALSGLLTIDDIALAAGDRVLVKDQTDATENGIWNVSSTAWGRAKDFDGARDVVTGTLMFVRGGGTENGSTFWRLTTADPVVIGTDDLTFALANTQLAGVSAFIQTLLDDASAPAARATLGAGTGNGDMVGANNLSDVADPGAAAANLGLEIGVDVLAPDGDAGSLTNILPRSYLAGLGLSNNGTDASHDIDIAVGAARDSGNTADIVLASALTKQIDAAWAVGTNADELRPEAPDRCGSHRWQRQHHRVLTTR